MYPVSEKYKKAIRDSTRKYYYSGKIITKDGTEHPFENKDIVKGSAYVTNQCCGNSEIELGSVYSAEMGITLYSNIDRYTLEGATITLSFFLLLDDETYEEVPLGIFEISEANRTINCLSIKAYDYMLRFDKAFNSTVSSGTAYEFLSLACENCEVELAHSQDEINSWNNGGIVLGIFFENDIETWRDVIYYVAQVLGCFCTINRQGQLELRKYKNIPIETIESKHRFKSTFSDFVTRYTAISSTNNRTQTAEYYSLENDDGLTMNLGVNPLLQFGLTKTREDILNHILNDISIISYVPFDSTTIGNPAFDLGDVITFSGGHADDEQITCITKYEYKINGEHILKCVGKNPKLAKTKSKNDKNIVGLLNSVEAGKIAVHTFMNASPYTICGTDTEIASIEFASNEDTDAQFYGTILLKVTADEVEKSKIITIPQVLENGETTQEISVTFKDEGRALIKVTYVINDNVLTTYCPIQSLHSGEHILNLYYPLNGLLANSYNTFRVWASVTNGTAVVERGQPICTISGQGLSSNNNWDGRLEFEDKINIIKLGAGLEVVKTADSVSTHTQKAEPFGAFDSFKLISASGINIVPIKDELSVNPVVITEIIEVADRDEMQFNTYFIKTESVFEFETDYEIKSREYPIDRGRMTKLIVNTEQFARIDSLEVRKDV